MLTKVPLQLFTWCVLTVVLLSPMLAVASTQLVMIEQKGCHYCEKWMAEIGDRYHLTEEGARAPLRRVHMEQKLPEDLPVELSEISVTPTFVLVHNGVEIDRLVGYTGDEFFWGQIQAMLKKLPAQLEVVKR